MTEQNKITTILKSGLIATAVMTMVMIAAPLMGMPEMRIGNMFADFLHIPAQMIVMPLMGSVFFFGYKGIIY